MLIFHRIIKGFKLTHFHFLFLKEDSDQARKRQIRAALANTRWKSVMKSLTKKDSFDQS